MYVPLPHFPRRSSYLPPPPFLDEALDVIGNGTFGLIRKVRRKADGMLFARKELNFERMSERDRKHIVSEVNILRTLQHENVVRYEERYVDTENGILYIVMELCEGGDLGSVIKRCRRTKTHLPEETVWAYFAQMTAALEACHYRKVPSSATNVGARAVQAILHRDLKPENVFLDADQNVKLGDFGLSKQMAAQSFANTYVGTPYYMSPELATGQPYDMKSDVWALGCIVYELCALSPPFDAENQTELTRKIKQGTVPALPRTYSRDLQDAVHAMLQLDHRRRPTTRQLLQIRQIKMACRTHDIAVLHKKVLLEKERLQVQKLALDEREASLSEREQKLLQEEGAWHRSSAGSSTLSKALEDRALALNQRELELCRREEACASHHQTALEKWEHQRALMQEKIKLLQQQLDETKTALSQASISNAASTYTRPRPRKSTVMSTPKGEEFLRSRIAEGALSLQSPPRAGRKCHVADDEWVDDEDEPLHRAATATATVTTTGAPPLIGRSRRADADLSDCSMKDASCMWREALPFRGRAEATPAKAKRTSLPETVLEGSDAPSLPTSRTMPMNLNNLPQEPQWHLMEEDERPSPFLKRVNRIPLESLKSDGLADDTNAGMRLVPGPAKPRSGPIRTQDAHADQENLSSPRARVLADHRRRRSSLLRPSEARPIYSNNTSRVEALRSRPSGIPHSPSARSLRPFSAAQRAR